MANLDPRDLGLTNAQRFPPNSMPKLHALHSTVMIFLGIVHSAVYIFLLVLGDQRKYSEKSEICICLDPSILI